LKTQAAAAPFLGPLVPRDQFTAGPGELPEEGCWGSMGALTPPPSCRLVETWWRALEGGGAGGCLWYGCSLRG